MTAMAATEPVSDQLARMSAQIDEISAELRCQRQEKEKWQELAHTLVPVTRDAFDVASRELGDLADDVTVDDAVRFLRTAARSLPKLEAMLVTLDSLAELIEEVTSISGAGVAKVSEVLAEAERTGWFSAARGVRQLAEAVVAEYCEDDAAAAIAAAPRVVALLRALADERVLTLVGQLLVPLAADAPEAPPSLLALAGQVRDPATRRGLGRALQVVRQLGFRP